MNESQLNLVRCIELRSLNSKADDGQIFDD